MNDEGGKVVAEIPLLSAKDKETTILTLFRFEMRKTRLQFKRIEEDRVALEAIHSSDDSSEHYLDSQARLFGDIHFLFVCIKKLESIFFKMRKYFPDNLKLKELEDRYDKLLGFCGGLRDDLEHIEDRPGKGVVGLGSTFGRFFQFDQKQIEIGTELSDEIETFFREVNSTVDQILIARRKESGERFVIMRSHVTIPGGPGTFQLKKDEKDRTS